MKSTIIGGYTNKMNFANRSTIIGGCGNYICGAITASIIEAGNSYIGNVFYSNIIGGYLNAIECNSGSDTIIGGSKNTITNNSCRSSIIGGYNNCINASERSAIIGGSGLYLNEVNDTVLMANLQVNSAIFSLSGESMVPGLTSNVPLSGISTLEILNGLIVGAF